MAQSSLCPPLVLLAGVQTDSTGELALEHRALGREHQKKRGKKENICSVVGRGQRKPSGHLFNFFVFLSSMPTGNFFGPPIFFLEEGTQTTLFKNKHSNFVRVYLSFCHICDSVPQTALFHFTPRGRAFVSWPTVPMNVLDSERHYPPQSFQSCPLLLSVVLL